MHNLTSRFQQASTLLHEHIDRRFSKVRIALRFLAWCVLVMWSVILMIVVLRSVVMLEPANFAAAENAVIALIGFSSVGLSVVAFFAVRGAVRMLVFVWFLAFAQPGIAPEPRGVALFKPPASNSKS